MEARTDNVGCRVPGLWIVASLFTTLVGQTIHGTWWGIVDFFFWPLVWIKWVLFGEVNLSVLKETIEPFLN